MSDCSTPTTPALARADVSTSRVPLYVKAAYGSGSFGTGIMQNSIWMYLMMFYTDIVLLPSKLVGAALSVGRLWDAFTDPLMGQISDRTRTRFGRRRPYIMFGSFLWGAAFAALWMASPGWGTTSKVAYLIVMDLMFATGLTVVSTPYMALGAEITSDYSERSRIVAYRFAFFTIGQVAGSSLLNCAGLIQRASTRFLEGSPALVDGFQAILQSLANTAQASWIAAAIIISMAAVVSLIISGAVPREQFATRAVTRFRLPSAIKTSLQNRNYLRLLGAQFCAVLAGQLGVPLVPYLCKYWLKRPEYIMLAFSTIAVAIVVALPLWMRVGRYLDKSVCFRIACAMAVFNGPISLLTINPRYPLLVFPWAMWAGVCQAGIQTFAQSILADIADEDELLTGERREGMYFGVYTLTQKLIGSFGLIWAGIALSLVGYVPNAEQSSGTLWGMRLLYACVSLGNAAGVILLRGFPLTRARTAEIQNEVRRRANAG